MKFQTFFTYYRNLKLRTKLLYIYLATAFVMLLLLLFVLRAAMGKQLYAHEQSMLNNALNRSVSQLESHINDAINLSEIINNNDEILTVCNVGYGKNYFEMYTAYTYSLQPNLYIYKSLIPQITDICIYSNCGILPYKDLIRDLAVLEEMPWFAQIKNQHALQWIKTDVDGAYGIAAVRKLPHTSVYPFDNYLYLTIDYRDFFASLSNISQDAYGIVITGADGSPLYQSHTFDSREMPIPAETISASYEKTKQAYANRYLFLSDEIPSVGWHIYYYSPAEIIKKTVTQTIFTIFGMIAFCFGMLFLLTFFLVNSMLSPLHQLTDVISRISLEDIGTHELVIIPNRTDEIGTLIHSFNAMLKRIRTLIDEVYVHQLKAKEYQLNALRAQINPHFLYNTLSRISARAVIAEQTEISHIVHQLTIFYRTSLNKGGTVSTIKNELENIKAYTSLQLILTDNSFETEYRLDENYLEVPMPSLILQPLVENAIEHGLRDSRRFPRRLTVTLANTRHGNRMCVQISIRDNGCGIPENKLQTLFALETGHLGIKNVNERLKLSCGEDYGLRVSSEEEKGTEVIILLPCD